MSTVIQKVVPLSLAAIGVGLAAPATLAAQPANGRPATIGLTVVVPSKASFGRALTSEHPASLINATANGLDLETKVGLANLQPARIEVRLGSGRPVASTQVWVRNAQGEFERLQRNASVVALNGPPLDPTQTCSALVFRVQSTTPIAAGSLAIPVEYRLTGGGGDTFSVWSFPSLLRLDSGPLTPGDSTR